MKTVSRSSQSASHGSFGGSSASQGSDYQHTVLDAQTSEWKAKYRANCREVKADRLIGAHFVRDLSSQGWHIHQVLRLMWSS
jgi:hypothetical protein